MTVRAVEPTKICARCERRLPFSAFHARTCWPDGTTRCPKAYCKKCSVVLTRERRARNPGMNAAACRRYREKRFADPAERQREYDRNRMNYILARQDAGLPYRPRFVHVDGEHALVPIEPLRCWLQRQLDDEMTQTAIAEIAGTTSRVVRRWLHTSRFVSVDLAERVLGDDFDDLYPDALLEAA